MKNYAESIAFLGQWGRFQQTVFFLLCASIMPNGFGAFTLVFVNDTPTHHCLVPDVNLTQDWRSAIIPVQVVNGKPEQSKCSRYRLDVVRNLSAQGYIPGRDINLTELEQERCVDGWSYSTDIYESTIVSEPYLAGMYHLLRLPQGELDAFVLPCFRKIKNNTDEEFLLLLTNTLPYGYTYTRFDLVCSDQWKQPFTSTVFFLGVLCGCFFSGQLSDRFGRKPVLFATIAVQTIFTFIQVFSSSWIMFTILLFINGLGQMSNFVAALVLGAEIMTGSVRVMYSSMGTMLGFAAGYMILPFLAYFLRNWKSLQLALSVPALAYIPFWWFIPESPRWLLSQGKVEEAEAIMRKAAKWNKVQAPQVIFEDCNADNTKTKENHDIFDLLRNSSIRMTTLILCFVSFTMITGYYCLSFNTSQLHADPYISCFISAAVEVPAYISSWVALRYFSRRRSVISILLVAAVSLFLIQLVPQDLSNLSLALEMLGKYSITTGASMMFTYTAELYPTVLRNTATGVCTTFSRLGSCITPFLLDMSSYFKYLPYITMGTLAVVSAFATLFLPESFGRPLPETIQQMAQRGRIKCPCVSRKHTPVPVDGPL